MGGKDWQIGLIAGTVCSMRNQGPKNRRWVRKCFSNALCRACTMDQAFLKRQRRPPHHKKGVELTVVDLFAGCGGMTVGLEEAARRTGCRIKVRLALDLDQPALSIYSSNFPDATTQVASVESHFDGAVGAALTPAERKTRRLAGKVDILVGGPPCQGHSDLNNHTRRKDPKNELYLRMARAVEVLKPKVVIIENVTPVQWDEGGVLQATQEGLLASGYRVAGMVLDLRRVGVPQRRKRFVLIATTLSTLDPTQLLKDLATGMPNHPDRSVRWAIADLLPISKDGIYDTASRVTKVNVKRIGVLFDRQLYDLPNRNRPKCHRDGNHSYLSMYGRLHWHRPAQTITTGFGSIGQGRYVHPQRRRTLTPHEAARLQTFPDWFDFGSTTPRGVLATVIGNAVPPLLMVECGASIIPLLVAARKLKPERNSRKV